MNKEAGEKKETPKTETPKTEAPKTETPKTEAPKTEAPKTEAPKTEAPKTEAPKEEPSTGESKQGVEEKLDRFADRFSKAMTDGVKRMEEAFDRGMKSLKDKPEITSGKVKGFFTSSTGGAVLLIVGFVWFFYAVGLLGQSIFPILMIIMGIYLMYRYRSK